MNRYIQLLVVGNVFFIIPIVLSNVWLYKNFDKKINENLKNYKHYSILNINNKPKTLKVYITLVNGSKNFPFLSYKSTDDLKIVQPGSYIFVVQAKVNKQLLKSEELYMLFEPNKSYELGYDEDSSSYYLNTIKN